MASESSEDFSGNRVAEIKRDRYRSLKEAGIYPSRIETARQDLFEYLKQLTNKRRLSVQTHKQKQILRV